MPDGALARGYLTPMETAVNALLCDMQDATAAAEFIDGPFGPKAIYVCTTNTVEGVPIAEDAARPSSGRRGSS